MQERTRQPPTALLKLCFDLYDVSDERTKESITSQFLFSQSIPKSISMSSEQLQLKVNKVYWFSVQAAAIQALPEYFPLPVDPTQSKTVASFVTCKFDVTKDDSPIEKVNKLTVMAERQPRVQVLHAAQCMYKSAREMLLDPLIYQQIPYNRTLLISIYFLVLYLSTAGTGVDDIPLLMSAARLHLNRALSILSVDLTKLDPIVRDSILDQGKTLERLITMLGSIELDIWVHQSAKSIGRYTEKHLKQYLKQIYKSLNVKFLSDPATNLLSKLGGIKELSTIVKMNGVTNLNGLTLFLDTSRRYRCEACHVVYWRLDVFTVQVIAVNVALCNCTNQDELPKIHALKLYLANEITTDCHDMLAITSYGGGRFAGILMFAFRTHLELSCTLCNHESTLQELNNCSVLLQKDLEICHCLISRNGLNMLHPIALELEKQSTIHHLHMSSVRAKESEQTLDNAEPVISHVQDAR